MKNRHSLVLAITMVVILPLYAVSVYAGEDKGSHGNKGNDSETAYLKECASQITLMSSEKAGGANSVDSCENPSLGLSKPKTVDGSTVSVNHDKTFVSLNLANGGKLVFNGTDIDALPALKSAGQTQLAAAVTRCYPVGGASTYCTNGRHGCYWYGDVLKWCN